MVIQDIAVTQLYQVIADIQDIPAQAAIQVTVVTQLYQVIQVIVDIQVLE